MNDPLNIWVGVHGIDKFGIAKRLGQVSNRRTDRYERFAEALATMGGHQHETLRRSVQQFSRQPRNVWWLRSNLRACQQQRIDDCIAGDVDPLRSYSLCQQISSVAI